MKWYLIDDCTTKGAFIDEEQLDVETKEEAAAIARSRFDGLSDHDKARRDAFYICLADCDEDGNIDYDTMTDFQYFK